MRSYPVPPTESERLAELRALQMLDTPPEEPFDGIADVAAALFGVPIALITFMDAERQWFKAKVGVPTACNARELSFCAHTIMGVKTLAVEDLTLDPRFRHNPHVAGPPHLRFYAGASLVTDRRECVGTVCVADFKPRAFGPDRCRLLERLARQTMDALEARRLIRELAEGRGK